MPLVYAMAIDHNKTTPNELINGYQGRYNIENKIITDAFPFDRLRAEDVVVFSSNIGIAQIAQKLGGIELYIGLKKFGLGDYSTISDYHENIGNIPSLYKLERPVYQATSAYGYGFSSNLMQIMRAYSVFTNQGVIITPSTFLNYDEGTKVLSNKTVETVNTALVESVQKGLAQAAQVEGLEIGGKTGMSHMIANGLYINHYHNSFVGYANDSNNSYIIGVLIVDPKTKIMSSQTAAPLFKKCVETLISEKYLFPKQSLNH